MLNLDVASNKTPPIIFQRLILRRKGTLNFWEDHNNLINMKIYFKKKFKYFLNEIILIHSLNQYKEEF